MNIRKLARGFLMLKNLKRTFSRKFESSDVGEKTSPLEYWNFSRFRILIIWSNNPQDLLFIDFLGIIEQKVGGIFNGKWPSIYDGDVLDV
jgi:hypothetical protein